MIDPMHVATRVGALVEPFANRRTEPDDVVARVAARAAALDRLGLLPGDRVFIHFGNTTELFVDLLAAWWLGASVVPLDPRLTPFEVGVLAAAARPRLSLLDDPEDELLGVLEDVGTRPVADGDLGEVGSAPPPPRLALDGEAIVLFTSGTTGDPKGVVHTHRTLRARWLALSQATEPETFERTLCLLPTHFGHGLICNSLFPWLSGHELHVLPPFRADVVSQLGAVVDEHEITFLSSVPTVWRLALRVARPPELATLRQIFCGSAPLSASLWQQIAAWGGGVDVGNAYGITETGSWVAGTPRGVRPEDGLVGAPWGATVAVLREGDDRPPGLAEECSGDELGDVWLNTPALMRGYLGRPDLTDAVVRNGWFRTGDVGRVDARGLLSLRGRKRDEINKGGMKVYPADVDIAAEQIAGVADACAFAIDDPLYGQDVGLAVVLDRPEVLDTLHDDLAARLGAHQLPARTFVLDEIPRTSRGKINRDVVAAACSERISA